MLQPAIQFLKNEYPKLRQLIVEGDIEALSARFTVLEEQGHYGEPIKRLHFL